MHTTEVAHKKVVEIKEFILFTISRIAAKTNSARKFWVEYCLVIALIAPSTLGIYRKNQTTFQINGNSQLHMIYECSEEAEEE